MTDAPKQADSDQQVEPEDRAAAQRAARQALADKALEDAIAAGKVTEDDGVAIALRAPVTLGAVTHDAIVLKCPTGRAIAKCGSAFKYHRDGSSEPNMAVMRAYFVECSGLLPLVWDEMTPGDIATVVDVIAGFLRS